jgi:TatD DNase family protein
MIDTHFHSLVMSRKGMDPRALLQEAFDKGLEAAVDIGTAAGDLAEREALLEGFDRIYFAAGLYPSLAGEGDLPLLMEALGRDVSSAGKKIVAIGECGIDLHWDYAPADRQQDLFEMQIAFANSLGLPVVVHNREADREILEVLRRCRPEAGGVMHCYSSGADVLPGFLDAGMFISFAGNLTFKNAELIRRAARQVPLDRVVFETDSPYLAPMPHRGKANHPALVEHSYRFFAQLRGLEMEELQDQVRRNVEALFPALHLSAPQGG